MLGNSLCISVIHFIPDADFRTYGHPLERDDGEHQIIDASRVIFPEIALCSNLELTRLSTHHIIDLVSHDCAVPFQVRVGGFARGGIQEHGSIVQTAGADISVVAGICSPVPDSFQIRRTKGKNDPDAIDI